MEPLELGADRDAEFLGAVPVEPALALLFDERVADRSGVVIGRERPDLVVVGRQGDPARIDGVDADREFGPAAGDGDEGLDLAPGAGGDVDGDGVGPLVEVHRLQQAGDAEDVVAVEVRDEDVADAEAGAEPHHLPLGTLAAVEQQAVAFAADEHRARVPLGRGHGPARAQERHAQRHIGRCSGGDKQPSVRSRRDSTPPPVVASTCRSGGEPVYVPTQYCQPIFVSCGLDVAQ